MNEQLPRKRFGLPGAQVFPAPVGPMPNLHDAFEFERFTPQPKKIDAPMDRHDACVPPGEPLAATGAFSLVGRDARHLAPHDPLSQPAVKANPFTWRDPSTIPPRQWLYGKHYVRKFASATIAPGGLGKSSLGLVEAVCMASGRNLLSGSTPKQLNVWCWNLEDPYEEIERRVAAIILHYQIPPGEIDGRLFLNSGREDPLIIAEKHKDAVIVQAPVVAALIAEIRRLKIDVLIIDPFVSSHGVPENDNGAIDRVVKTWAKIADETGCSIDLVHHVRKPGNGQAAEFTVDDARGAVALIGAVRSARVLNAMSQQEADCAGIPLEERRSYFRVDNGKANMAPPAEKAEWRKFVSEPLGNDTADDPGDWVGVVTKWQVPDAFDGVDVDDLRKVQDKIGAGEWAENIQANNWAGHAIADALGLDAGANPEKGRIKRLLKAWISSGALKVEMRPDKRQGRDKPMIVVGKRA